MPHPQRRVNLKNLLPPTYLFVVFLMKNGEDNRGRGRTAKRQARKSCFIEVSYWFD